MRFNRVEAENFLSIGQMKLDLDNRGLLLVVGENNDDPSAESNGAGKSSFIEAMYWCIYGKTLRGIKYVDSIVNRVTKKDCHVRLDMDVPNGKLVIDRYRKHKDHKNDISVFLNGNDISSSDPRITQAMIDSEVGMDSDTFARLIVIGQGFTFRYTDMSDKELKEFIEGLIGSNTFSTAYDLAKSKLAEAKSNLVAVDSKLLAVTSQLESLKAQHAQKLSEATTKKSEIDISIQVMLHDIVTLGVSKQYVLGKIQEAESAYNAEVQKYSDTLASLEGIKKAAEDLYTKEKQRVASDRFALLEKHKVLIESASQSFDKESSLLRDTLSELNSKKLALSEGNSKKLVEVSNNINAVKSAFDSAIRSRTDDARTISLRLQQLSSNTQLQQLKETLLTQNVMLKNLEREVEVAKIQPGSKCPTCGQPVDEKSFEAHINEKMDFTGRRSNLVNGIEFVTKQIIGVEKDIDTQKRALETDLSKASSEIQEMETSKTTEVAKLEKLIPSQQDSSEEVKAINEAIRDTEGKYIASETNKRNAIKQVSDSNSAEVKKFEDESYNVLREKEFGVDSIRLSISGEQNRLSEYKSKYETDRRSKQSEVDRLDNEIYKKSSQVEQLSKVDVFSSVSLIQGQIDSVMKTLETEGIKKVALDEDIYVYDYLTSAFGLGGIRSFILDSVLTYLNDRIKVYCQELFDGNTSIYLSPVKQQKNNSLVEKITIEVTTDGGSYDASSGGERRKVDVALFLAFRDLSKSSSPVSTNFEAYDEILAFLDGESASRVVQLLLKDESVSTKVLITHRNDISIVGRHQILKAIKTNGITEYKEN